MARAVGSFIVCMFSTLVFLISGLLINLVQALVYLLFYNRNKNLYRKINYYLIYTSWSQILALAEWGSNISCNIYGDEESLKTFGKDHSIVLMNHKYDLDWLMCWFVCDKLKMLGNAKTVAKKSLRNVPVVGWGWIFAEMIFLERNWEKDKLILGPQLDNLVEYEDPIMLLFFCEGTRFTPEKHKAGVEFAKSRNLPLLKHHLCPRTNGFNLTAHHMKTKIPAVFDIELAFPETPLKPTFFNILWGNSFVGDMYIRRIPMDQIPTDTEEATTKWVHNLYQEKDKVMDDYLKTNKFPGKCITLNRSVRTLMHSILWNLLIGVPFLYLIFKLLVMGSTWVTVATVTVIVLLFSVMYMMVQVTEADKGSSYGSQAAGDKKSPSTTAENGVLNEETNGQCKNSKERELPNLSIPKVRVTMYQNDANGNEQTEEKL